MGAGMLRITYTVEQSIGKLREADVALSKRQPVVHIPESPVECHVSP